MSGMVKTFLVRSLKVRSLKPDRVTYGMGDTGTRAATSTPLGTGGR